MHIKSSFMGPNCILQVPFHPWHNLAKIYSHDTCSLSLTNKTWQARHESHYGLAIYIKKKNIWKGRRVKGNEPTNPTHVTTSIYSIICGFLNFSNDWWGYSRTPKSSKGLKCEPKYSNGKGGVGARSITHNPLRGRGAGWSSGMGLGRVDKF